MISSAPVFTIFSVCVTKIGQKRIIQSVPVVSDILGHFVPIYWRTSLLCIVGELAVGGSLALTVVVGVGDR